MNVLTKEEFQYLKKLFSVTEQGIVSIAWFIRLSSNVPTYSKEGTLDPAPIYQLAEALNKTQDVEKVKVYGYCHALQYVWSLTPKFYKWEDESYISALSYLANMNEEFFRACSLSWIQYREDSTLIQSTDPEYVDFNDFWEMSPQFTDMHNGENWKRVLPYFHSISLTIEKWFRDWVEDSLKPRDLVHELKYEFSIVCREHVDFTRQAINANDSSLSTEDNNDFYTQRAKAIFDARHEKDIRWIEVKRIIEGINPEFAEMSKEAISLQYKRTCCEKGVPPTRGKPGRPSKKSS